MTLDPLTMLRPRRRIVGISAVLLPYQDNGEIDWPSFERLLSRTASASLTPAVNMDTGYAHLLNAEEKRSVLERTKSILAGAPFVAGAMVLDQPSAKFDGDAYQRQMEEIASMGGTPVLFQNYGLTTQADDQIIASYERLAQDCDRFIGFELGTMFAPFGAIYSLDVYRGLLNIRACIGAKHSSLNRQLEWQRLQMRNELRPDFHVYTGNDLAIDMVMYGSDYLLGLSSFAPDVFAKRDAYWAASDARFYELNDALQYLGCLAFRDPVPAYKHSAAMFLKLRNWIVGDYTHPKSATRPESDRDILRAMLPRLGL